MWVFYLQRLLFHSRSMVPVGRKGVLRRRGSTIAYRDGSSHLHAGHLLLEKQLLLVLILLLRCHCVTHLHRWSPSRYWPHHCRGTCLTLAKRSTSSATYPSLDEAHWSERPVWGAARSVQRPALQGSSSSLDQVLWRQRGRRAVRGCTNAGWSKPHLLGGLARHWRPERR